MTAPVAWLERAAEQDPQGLLILHHGRGSDERDLLQLGEELDPHHRFHVITPGGPLRIEGWPGKHWYRVPEVGYPDQNTFWAAVQALSAFHDQTWQRTGIPPGRSVVGGFSMGAVMSYALGLSARRPAPAGIVAFSGFVPTVPGWSPSLRDRTDVRAFIAHGRRDPVMQITFAHHARDLLVSAGLDVSYHESSVGHEIDVEHVDLCADWLLRTLKANEIQDGQHA